MIAPPRRKPLTTTVKLEVALLALGVKESEIDWSHEPALGLRAYNEHDYDPPQLDPRYIFIRKRAEHDHITFKDNGTGRGDLTAIAKAKRVARDHANFVARQASKLTGEAPPEPPHRKRTMASRPFSKQHRPMRRKSS